MAFETISLGTQPAGTGGDTARTAFEKVNRNFIATEVLAAAMSQAQFDANRNANKERYAASGFVHFGNHEDGKQVNEAKSGLYTSLTTPNILLIGKSGGVGSSKTDNAVVNIDGVIFNLTTEYSISLPNPPISVSLSERIDIYGLETEIVEISEENPSIYPGGLRGVSTPINFFSLTNEQKRIVLSDNNNTTFIGVDGKLYQHQIYSISFAGTTNGVTSPSEQGYVKNLLGDLWIKGGVKLLYIGDVNRINAGAYDLSLNPSGASTYIVQGVGWLKYYQRNASFTGYTTKQDCFNFFIDGANGVYTAKIENGKSGRPDKRVCDAIYANGQGGVCRDMRYSANSLSLSDFSDANHKIKIGKYRGFEGEIFTRVHRFTVSEIGAYLGGYYVRLAGASSLSALADKAHTMFFNETKNIAGYVPVLENDTIYLSLVDTARGLPNTSDASGGASIMPYTESSVGDVIYLIAGKEVSFYVGGSFLQTDVIATPANIMSESLFNNGWLGSWINPVGPTAKLTRKSLGVPETLVLSSGSWSAAGNSFSNILNEVHNHVVVNSAKIAIHQYQAFAKQTENAPNAVINGLLPSNVLASSDYQPANGALLGEALIRKVLKNNSGISVNNKSLLSCSIDSNEKLTSASSFDGVTHSASTLGAPANNSPAFKAVSYPANINRQAVLHYAYTELKHNGTNWGDDGKVTIVDNQSTKTDLNGNTVLVGTAKLKEPIGWIKNNI
ncbi:MULTISPECIES: hypothetical protein [unclassified Shewanella]|uniref:hypothetical protein n=1 Tax=Shewanella TaxID=22 RepID=UPI0021DB28C0|nr:MULTISPECIES: hypothetical protein [unclassified Shewanella]MCU8044347.1 hypothetical protein [Shewanella sp. SM68]MCU8048429.1 hypothetical protein [Shewanella sp. SM65]